MTVQAHFGRALFPLRLIFVNDRNRKDAYLALATTDMNLRPNQIVSLYQRRWQIEGYFKAAKQYLRLTRTQILDYDGIWVHTAIVMLAYDLLVWQRRLDLNQETLGDVFYKIKDAMPTAMVLETVLGLTLSLIPLCKQYGMPSDKLNNAVDRYLISLPRKLEESPDWIGCS